jgi:DNA-binding beta-propeller fold protein YncE
LLLLKLTINFSSSATNAAVQALTQAILYRSTSDDPTGNNTTRTITFTLTDKNSASASDTSTITIIPTNDAPSITSSPSVTTATEDSKYSYELNASDIENDTLTWSATGGTSLPSWLSLTKGLQFDSKFGSYGTDDGKFYYPRRVAIDSTGNIYVADNMNHRIQKFDSNGNFIFKIGKSDNTSGVGDGEFNKPTGIAVDSSGNIYVVEELNHRVQKFNTFAYFIYRYVTIFLIVRTLNFLR